MQPTPGTDPGGFEVSLLGSFALSRAGRPLPLKPSEQRLIAFLAVRCRPVSRALLAGTLWPETTEGKAYARLRTGLWRCHQEVGDGLIAASSAGVWLADGVAVDMHELHDRIDEMVATGVPAIAPNELTLDVLDSWYDEWVLVEREQFRQLRLHALDLSCQLRRESGRYVEALLAGLAAVAAEPLRESAHAEVIKVHLAEGNVWEAVRQFQLYEEVLRTELGARPSSALSDLFAPVPVAVAVTVR